MKVYVVFVEGEDLTEVFFDKIKALKYAKTIIVDEGAYEEFLNDCIGYSFSYGRVELFERNIQ